MDAELRRKAEGGLWDDLAPGPGADDVLGATAGLEGGLHGPIVMELRAIL